MSIHWRPGYRDRPRTVFTLCGRHYARVNFAECWDDYVTCPTCKLLHYLETRNDAQKPAQV
jgi:hypothetical protein